MVEVENHIRATAALKAAHLALLHEDVDVAAAHMKLAIDCSIRFWKALKDSRAVKAGGENER